MGLFLVIVRRSHPEDVTPVGPPARSGQSEALRPTPMLGG